MSLSGWIRLGILVSVIWAIGAGSLMRAGDVDAAVRMRSVLLRLCTSDKYLKPDLNLAACEQNAARNYDLSLEHSWTRAMAGALIPVALTWLVVWLIVAMTRRVRRELT